MAGRTWEPAEIQTLINCLKQGIKGPTKLAEKIPTRTASAIESFLKDNKIDRSNPTWPEGKFQSKPDGAHGEETEQIVQDVREDALYIKTRSVRIQTLEQALEAAKVDLEAWDVERHIINFWEMGRKDIKQKLQFKNNKKTGTVTDSGRVNTHTLYQVKVWLKPRVVDPVQTAIDAIAAKFDQRAVTFPKVTYHQKPSPHMLVLGLADHHFGLLAWGPEVGGYDYDLKIAEHLYVNAAQNLVEKAGHINIDKILLPVGNDFFHIDDPTNTTPRTGNRLDVDSRFAKIYQTGFEAVIKVIQFARQIAPVEVIWVPGNHDPTTSFCLVHALDCWFRSAPDVAVDIRPVPRKYVHYGINLLGFTHGVDEKDRDLPGLIATECPEFWNEGRYREILKGHFYKKKETWFTAADTWAGIQMRTMVSLCGTDFWHFLNAYIKTEFLRAAEAFLYSHEYGSQGYFSCNVAEIGGNR